MSATWERIDALFHAALDRSPEARDAFLVAECGDDTALLARLRAMLAADADPGGLLTGGLAAAAGVVFAAAGAAVPPRTFGPYRVTGVLGEGGMGVVLRAHREDLSSDVAVKVLRDAALSPARRERFTFEQQALAQLNHPAIARLYDAGTLEDGTPWFAMELVDGQPITEYCRSRELPLAARLRLFREVCAAVEHAHEHAILHRDLKPSNILVRANGQVKLLDFGIAKSLDTLENPDAATRTGMRLMTPAYAAPEQMRGGALGVRTDVYALGVVLYELLAGRLPFELAGRTPSEAATLVTSQTARRPSAVAAENAALPSPPPGRGEWSDLDVLCLTAMHRDPERRYANVGALTRDLDRFLAGRPLEARGDSLAYRAGKYVRRNAGAVAATTAGIALLIAVVAFYTWRLAASRDAARAETTRAERIERFMTNLFQGGDPEAGPTDTLRVVSLLERGLLASRGFASEPLVRTRLERTLGTIYMGLGRFDRADSLLSTAYAAVSTQRPEDDAEIVLTRVALAMLRAEQQRFAEAESLARGARQLADARLPRRDARRATAAAALGAVLDARGEHEEATSVLREAVRLRATTDSDSTDIFDTWTLLANNQFYLGRQSACDSINQLVLAATRRQFGSRHPNVADDLTNIAYVLRSEGQYARAESLFHEALDITRGWYGSESPKTADCLTNWSEDLIVLERNDEAASALAEAYRILVNAYGKEHRRVAATLNAMGNLQQNRNQLKEAAESFRGAIDIYRHIYGPHHSALGVTLANLGGVYMQAHENREAERYFREALEAYSGAVPDDHPDPAITRIKLGRVLMRQKRYREAARESRRGYDVLISNAVPGIGFLRAARTDLVVDYGALDMPAEAARFRAELAALPPP